MEVLIGGEKEGVYVRVYKFTSTNRFRGYMPHLCHVICFCSMVIPLGISKSEGARRVRGKKRPKKLRFRSKKRSNDRKKNMPPRTNSKQNTGGTPG